MASLLAVCLSAVPTMNALDNHWRPISEGARPLAEVLFGQAEEIISNLHELPPEGRSAGDYYRALNSYSQAVRLSRDPILAARSLERMAELQREMGDTTGNGAFYKSAVENFRRIITEYPQSNLVGDALLQIARIHEESLQDLDGAAEAYRELIGYFPHSTVAREAGAILLRLEEQIQARGRLPDVSSSTRPRPASGLVRLTNLRNFSGPDYARVVLDLSGDARYSNRASENRLTISLHNAAIDQSLYGRRFIVNQSGLLRRIAVSDRARDVQIEIEASSISDISTFKLSNPERIIVDIYSSAAAARSRRIEAGSRRAGLSSRTILSLPEVELPDAPPRAGPEAAAHGAPPIRCIVIDPGHGGHDSGTRGASGVLEKEITLDVARRLRARIKRDFPDIEVVLTREGDRYVSLEERTAIANSRRADLFISIHANAAPSRAASGVETYFVQPGSALIGGGQSQSVLSSVSAGNRIAASRELARYIQAGLVRGVGSSSPRTAINRGVKRAPFAVLVRTAMPSVLAEISFLSNPRDEALLETPQFRDRVATSLFAGMKSYLEKLSEQASGGENRSP